MHVCILGLMAAAGLALFPAAAEARMEDAPKFVAPVDEAIPKGTRVDVVADKLFYDGRSDVATATGTVQLTYGPYVLTATRVVYDMRNGTFNANGSIILREPNGNVLEAEFAELKDTFREGFARHVRAGAHADDSHRGFGKLRDKCKTRPQGMERSVGEGACAFGKNQQGLALAHTVGSVPNQIDPLVPGDVAAEMYRRTDERVAHQRGF